MGNFNRDNRGQGRDRGFRRERPQMHETICSDCGKKCEVPFRPTTEKPVYCNDCFQDHGGKARRDFGKSDQRGGRFQDKRQDNFRDRNTDNQCKEAIDRLANKMDVIIDLLTVKQETKKTNKPEKTKAKPVVKKKK